MLDTAGLLRDLRALVAAELGPAVGVWAAGDPQYPLPAAVSHGPAVLLYPGRTRDLEVTAADQTHTYEVHIVVVQGGAWEYAPVDVLPLVDRLMDLLARRLRLGRSDVIVATVEGSSGYSVVQWGGAELVGYQLTLLVVQRASATPGV
jgi:hypothetical protein